MVCDEENRGEECEATSCWVTRTQHWKWFEDGDQGIKEVESSYMNVDPVTMLTKLPLEYRPELAYLVMPCMIPQIFPVGHASPQYMNQPKDDMQALERIMTTYEKITKDFASLAGLENAGVSRGWGKVALESPHSPPPEVLSE